MTYTPMAGPTGKTGSKVPSGYKQGQIQQFTPEMMDFMSQLMQMLGPDSFMSQIAGGDQSAFEQMEAPALRQFTGLQGNLASKFSGMGMGGRRSSGFTNTMNSAASDFAQQLQSKRTDMRMQAIKDMQNMGNQLLSQKPYETFLMEKDLPFWKKLLGATSKAAGAGAGGYFGGPQGAAAGYQAGSGFSQGMGWG